MPITPGLLARHTPKGPQGRPAALIDIAQDLLLAHLVSAGIFDLLVFKGGTALRKTFAGAAGRFSTDLDFSLRHPDLDRQTVQDLLTNAIDGYTTDGFSYAVQERRGRPEIVYDTPFGSPGALTTKLDVGPPVWIEPVDMPWVPMPIHRAYTLPASIPVMALEENIAEKIARLNRRTPARDVYDLVWVATNSPHSQFDRPLVRKLSILKCWVDTYGLHTNGIDWAGPPGAIPFDPERWLRTRARREFDDESIGVLANPAPDIDDLAAALRTHYGFLADLGETDRPLLDVGPTDRQTPISQIQHLSRGVLADTPLW